jgi:ribosome assembly protein YihI (activator of Der GTPase)
MAEEGLDDLDSVRKELTKRLDRLAADKPILTPRKQRIIWARLTAVKRLLVKAGLTTHEEFEEMVEAMVRDIDNKVKENLAKELGLYEEG